jgi:DNA-binding LytR/AlgR family response regulator
MREPTDPVREPAPAAVHASPTAIAPTAISLPRILVVCLVGGVFLGLLGPLGMADASLGLRLGYWIVATVGGGLLGWAVTLGVMRWLPPMNRWLLILVIAAVMTPPGTALVWLWGLAALGSATPFNHPLALAGPVLLISLAMTAINRLIAPDARPQAPYAAEGPASTAAAFQDRLPPRLRGAALYAVEAEDHYLRVHTSRGSDLILLRLGDALSELAALDGARTHRSWWVARAAIETVRRHDGRATLVLVNGLEAPVSRAQAPALRQAGWL